MLEVAAAGVAIAAMAGAARAEATGYGFEDLTVPSFTAVPIPDGYAGAVWTGWVLRRTVELNGTGLNANDVSNVLATAVDTAPTITFAQPVTFDGAFLINPHSTASFDLYLGGSLVYSSPVRDAGNASFAASGYALPIDRVVFHYPSYGISIDDVALTPVPEPAPWALLAAGLAALAGLRRAPQPRR